MLKIAKLQSIKGETALDIVLYIEEVQDVTLARPEIILKYHGLADPDMILFSEKL